MYPYFRSSVTGVTSNLQLTCIQLCPLHPSLAYRRVMWLHIMIFIYLFFYIRKISCASRFNLVTFNLFAFFCQRQECWKVSIRNKEAENAVIGYIQTWLEFKGLAILFGPLQVLFRKGLGLSLSLQQGALKKTSFVHRQYFLFSESFSLNTLEQVRFK